MYKDDIIEAHRFLSGQEFEDYIKAMPEPLPHCAELTCLCGKTTSVRMIGNNNADGKAKCGCGRNITVHLRRHKGKK